ncbi:MAG: tetratricopeptide repeat protein [Thermotogae bacterium]|nr:tetratricopeptide repeat protein [Thermotogota bacterium]
MRKWFLGVLLAGGVMVVSGCKLFKAQDTTPEVASLERLLSEGWSLYKAGKFDSALAKFDTAVSVVDPSNMEAHLGKGLSLMRLGLYPDAHQEFALIYTPYVQENEMIVGLHVSDTLESVYSSGFDPRSLLRVDGNGRLPSSPNYWILGVWKLGPIFADNGISFEDDDYIYLPVDLRSIIVKPDTALGLKSISPSAFLTAFTPTTVPLNVTSSSASYTDPDGPVIMLTSSKGGSDRTSEFPLLKDWLEDDGVGDSLFLTMTTMKISKTGLGEYSDIVWMALAADAHTYYMEAIDNKRAAYLAFVAYMLFPMRGDIGADKGYADIPGLSDDDTGILNGLAGVAALGYYKADWIGNAVSIIRFFGDSTYPSGDWNYLPDTYEEMVGTVGFTRDRNFNASVYQKTNELFFGM